MATRTTWEYKAHKIETKSFLVRGAIDPERIEEELGEFGREGWELVSCAPVGDGAVGTARLLLLFKRAGNI